MQSTRRDGYTPRDSFSRRSCSRVCRKICAGILGASCCCLQHTFSTHVSMNVPPRTYHTCTPRALSHFLALALVSHARSNDTILRNLPYAECIHIIKRYLFDRCPKWPCLLFISTRHTPAHTSHSRAHATLPRTHLHRKTLAGVDRRCESVYLHCYVCSFSSPPTLRSVQRAGPARFRKEGHHASLGESCNPVLLGDPCPPAHDPHHHFLCKRRE